MVLFVIPESWFVRLWGEWEFSVRAPLLMYLALLYPVLTQLIRTGREAAAALRPADHALIVAALLRLHARQRLFRRLPRLFR